MEWIIVDDGTDKIEDLVNSSNIEQIKYYKVDKKMSLGEKRNYMHKFVKGTIIVYMDDDDYYPPERVSHAVDKLQENKQAMCAGSSEIYVYFKHISTMYQFGPYGPNHATAGTFAFRTELLKSTSYEDHAALAEEKKFLKNYTVPFVQLDPLKTILVFSHIHNTFDKRNLLKNPNTMFQKESPKTVDDFIRKPEESLIKDFFMKNIDGLLDAYKPGEPSMKPDVLEQMKKMEKERAEMAMKKQQQQQQDIKITMNKDDGKSVQLSIDDINKLFNYQQNEMKNLQEKNKKLEDMVLQLQRELVLKSFPESIPTASCKNDISNNSVQEHPVLDISKSKTEPEINIEDLSGHSSSSSSS
tara:strand:- start:2924 stop:3991 length:1068 start_codon:yes stop_codon:yes gene_type:complete